MCLLAILLGSFITPGDESIVGIGRNTTTTILMCYMVPLFVCVCLLFCLAHLLLLNLKLWEELVQTQQWQPRCNVLLLNVSEYSKC